MVPKGLFFRVEYFKQPTLGRRLQGSGCATNMTTKGATASPAYIRLITCLRCCSKSLLSLFNSASLWASIDRESSSAFCNSSTVARRSRPVSSPSWSDSSSLDTLSAWREDFSSKMSTKILEIADRHNTDNLNFLHTWEFFHCSIWLQQIFGCGI